MIQCKRCKKQYIGETKRTLRERFKEHRQATNNSTQTPQQQSLPTLINLAPLDRRHGTYLAGITTHSQHVTAKGKRGVGTS